MARPEARGLGPGLGLKYEIVLRAGPGHNCCGPGLGLINQFAGRVCTTTAGPGRAWASNHICGSGLDFRPVQGPSVYNVLPKVTHVMQYEGTMGNFHFVHNGKFPFRSRFSFIMS